MKDVSRARVPYARILSAWCPSALGLIAIAFVLWLTGLAPRTLDPASYAQVRVEGAAAHLSALGTSPGWHWLSSLRTADLLCALSLALLAMGTPVACLAAAIQYVRRREGTLAAIALAQALVVLAAAAGLIVVKA